MPLVSAWEVSTPAEFAEMQEIIKTGIVEILEDELVPLVSVSGEKIPRVRNRRIVEIDPGTWAKRLSSPRHLEGPAGEEEEKINSFLVGYAGITSESNDNTTGGKSFRASFLIDAYYEDETGTDADNAEKRHSELVHRVAYVLWMSRTLRRPKFVKNIVSFNERRGFARMGEKLTRESLAEIVVDENAVPMLQP